MIVEWIREGELRAKGCATPPCTSVERISFCCLLPWLTLTDELYSPCEGRLRKQAPCKLRLWVRLCRYRSFCCAKLKWETLQSFPDFLHLGQPFFSHSRPFFNLCIYLLLFIPPQLGEPDGGKHAELSDKLMSHIFCQASVWVCRKLRKKPEKSLRPALLFTLEAGWEMWAIHKFSSLCA